MPRFSVFSCQDELPKIYFFNFLLLKWQGLHRSVDKSQLQRQRVLFPHKFIFQEVERSLWREVTSPATCSVLRALFINHLQVWREGLLKFNKIINHCFIFLVLQLFYLVRKYLFIKQQGKKPQISQIVFPTYHFAMSCPLSVPESFQTRNMKRFSSVCGYRWAYF